MGSHKPFRHLKHKLWPKERSGIKLAVWLLTTKSQESTRCPYVQVACNMPLESSRRGIQLCFKPHPNRRFAQKVIIPQSCRSSNVGDFEIPVWESQDKKSFGWGHRKEVQSILYGGRWWLPLSSGCAKSCKSKVTRGSS
jgi:hypothetical protein